jgi:hypothetical protein
MQIIMAKYYFEALGEFYAKYFFKYLYSSSFLNEFRRNEMSVEKKSKMTLIQDITKSAHTVEANHR